MNTTGEDCLPFFSNAFVKLKKKLRILKNEKKFSCAKPEPKPKPEPEPEPDPESESAPKPEPEPEPEPEA